MKNKAGAPTQKSGSPSKGTPVSLYEYFDYRKFLGDLYQFRKSIDKKFTYRSFARKAGINSSAIYLLLVNGKQRMTAKLLPKFARGLELSSHEAKYLELMVSFTHAGAAKDKQKIFDKMIAHMPEAPKMLRGKYREYYKNWYHIAIRESLSVINIGDDARPLANFLHPSVGVVKIKHSLALLSDLGLIEKNHRGHYKATQNSLRSTPELGAVTIRRYQKNMIDMAGTALDKFTRDERHIACSTFSISRKGREKINGKLEELMNEVENIVREDKSEDDVMQLNVQFFPLTQKGTRGKK